MLPTINAITATLLLLTAPLTFEQKQLVRSKPTIKPQMHDVQILTWEDGAPYVFKKNSNKNVNNTFDGILVRMVNNFKKFCNSRKGEELYRFKIKNVCVTTYDTFTKVLYNVSLLTTKDFCGFKYNQQLTFLGPMSFNRSIQNFQVIPFTQSSSIGVIVQGNDISILAKAMRGIGNSFSLIYLSLTLAVIVGALIWLIEHRENDVFHQTFAKGLCSGFWFSFITMTTTGYGDKVPKHFLSRFIVIIWSYTGILLVASVTAVVMDAVAKDFDLTNKPVSVLKGYVEKDLVRTTLKGHKVEYDSYDAVLNAVAKGATTAAFIESNCISTLKKNKNVFSELHVERLIQKTARIYFAIAENGFSSSTITKEYADPITYIKRCSEEFDEEIMSELHNQLVPTFETTYYLVRPFRSILDPNSDKGVLLYLTIIVILLVGLSILTELIRYVRKISNLKPEKTVQIKRSITQKCFKEN